MSINQNISNRYGFDVGNNDNDDERFIDRDYSIGGGVSMERRDWDRGFPHDYNDRVRGLRGTQRGEFFGKGPKGWERSDDRIKEEVCEILYVSPNVDASDIDVTVQDGCVQLTGMVDRRRTKREAEECIEDIPGVHDVRNELRVRRTDKFS